MNDWFAAVLGIAMATVTSVHASEVPSRTFFSGNDVYNWCRYDRKAAISYVAGVFDQAAYAAAALSG